MPARQLLPWALLLVLVAPALGPRPAAADLYHRFSARAATTLHGDHPAASRWRVGSEIGWIQPPRPTARLGLGLRAELGRDDMLLGFGPELRLQPGGRQLRLAASYLFGGLELNPGVSSAGLLAGASVEVVPNLWLATDLLLREVERGYTVGDLADGRSGSQTEATLQFGLDVTGKPGLAATGFALVALVALTFAVVASLQ